MSITPKTYVQTNTKGYQSSLDSTEIEDGKLRFTTDTGRLYLDIVENSNGKRVRISDIEDSLTEDEIAAILAPLPKIYLAKDTHKAYVFADSRWYDISRVMPQELNKKAATESDYYLWFSGPDAEQPEYDKDIKYDINTNCLYAPKMAVKDGLNIGEYDPSDPNKKSINITLSTDSEGNNVASFRII